MEVEGTQKNTLLPRFARVNETFWKQRLLAWTIILAIFAPGGIFTTWLFADSSSLAKSPFAWFYQYRLPIAIALLVLALLFALSGIIRLLPASKSEYILKRKYLYKLSGDQMTLALSGIPTGLVKKSILLEKIFIHLLFHPASSTNIQPLSEGELEPYQRRREKGLQVEEMTRLINEATHERDARETQTIDISAIWRRLTRNEPAAVIQGYPGIGKSTLLSRITLSMARRSLHRPDPDPILSALQPVQIPLFISLKEYAHNYKKEQPSSLLAFMQSSLPRLLTGPGTTEFPSLLERWLDDGLCLVLFDGLDEAASQGDEMRRIVQQEIREFIRLYRHRERTTGSYNRFLITSRIAGYDLAAFSPDYYPNYIIAYLEQEQIEHFLPRWCTASIDPAEVGLSAETLQQKAHEVSERLMQAVRTNRGVEKLAQIPLLLTLMAAMQQKGTELPRSRAELYARVTETLLDKRNYDKGINPLPVAQAIQRLGPLAYKMHEREHGLATGQEVLTALATAIRTPQGGGGTI